jgi:hypothetical protein
MAVDPVVLGPVLAEPSLPSGAPRALDINRTDLGIACRRTLEEGLTVKGYRFEGDKLCKAERFDSLRRELGAAYDGITLPDSAGNPKSPMAKAGQPPHSVFTGNLIDEPGQPTREAVDNVILFIREKLASTFSISPQRRMTRLIAIGNAYRPQARKICKPTLS